MQTIEESRLLRNCFSGCKSCFLGIFILLWCSILTTGLSAQTEKPRSFFEIKDTGGLYFPASVANFRGTSGKTSVEFSLGVISRLVEWRTVSNYEFTLIYYDITITDLQGNKVADFNEYRRITTKTFTEAQKQIFKKTSTQFIINKKFNLDPGTYDVKIKALDTISEKGGEITDRIEVEDFSSGSLQISDIILSLDIIGSGNEKVDENRITSFKENVRIARFPSHIVPLEKPFYIAYDIYNLSVRAGDGNNNYKVQYAMIPVRQYSVDAVRHTKLVKNLKDISADERYGIAYSNYSQGPDDSQFMRIDHSIKKEGEYILTLRITDRLNGQTTEKSIPIWFYKTR